jgi:hypothetical protein
MTLSAIALDKNGSIGILINKHPILVSSSDSGTKAPIITSSSNELKSPSVLGGEMY